MAKVCVTMCFLIRSVNSELHPCLAYNRTHRAVSDNKSVLTYKTIISNYN